MMVREEPRAVVVAQLDTPAGPLTVANTHLSFVPGWNRVQLRRLRRDLAGLPGPARADGRPQPDAAGAGPVARLRPLGAAPTFPADDPTRQLDHILVDDSRAARRGVRPRRRCSISDHRPFVVDVGGFGSTRSG